MKPKLNEKDLMCRQQVKRHDDDQIRKAIELFGLSNRKFRALLASEHRLPFLAVYGSRKLIIRQEFERYLQKPGIKEALLNGRR